MQRDGASVHSDVQVGRRHLSRIDMKQLLFLADRTNSRACCSVASVCRRRRPPVTFLWLNGASYTSRAKVTNDSL